MTYAQSRRDMLRIGAVAGPLLLTAPKVLAREGHTLPLPGSIPVATLPAHYDIDTDVHNLEAGYWSPMPRMVAAAYARHIVEVNRENSIFARNVLPGEACLANGSKGAQAAIAGQLGCHPDEIGIMRSGSDALQMLIGHYRPLKAGDAVISCDLDYDAAIGAMDWLGTHRGARVVRFAIPEPATTANILAAYEAVLARTPTAKLLLVTQVSNRTGLIMPVREIVAMARARGVDTIVDAAHGVALLDYQLDDLGADFVAWSVHKWTSAPLGTGAMYIRRSRIADIEIAYENHHLPAGSINAREPAGTVNFAALLTIPVAVGFHAAIGAAAREKHMRQLRDRWVDAVRDVPGVTMAVPDDPARYCAITSFRLNGMDSDDKAIAVQRRLFEKHRILTVWRNGVAAGPVIRVTPGLYSTTADVDALARALHVEHGMFA